MPINGEGRGARLLPLSMATGDMVHGMAYPLAWCYQAQRLNADMGKGEEWQALLACVCLVLSFD